MRLEVTFHSTAPDEAKAARGILLRLGIEPAPLPAVERVPYPVSERTAGCVEVREVLAPKGAVTFTADQPMGVARLLHLLREEVNADTMAGQQDCTACGVWTPDIKLDRDGRCQACRLYDAATAEGAKPHA